MSKGVYVICEYEKQVCPVDGMNPENPCPHTYYSEYGQFTDSLSCPLYKDENGNTLRGKGSSNEPPCARLTWLKKTIAKTVKRFAYEEHNQYDTIIIGNTEINTQRENVIFLSVDYGHGEQILIDEREGETMAKELTFKELTFGEVAEMVKKFKEENPNAGDLELFAYAFGRGQASVEQGANK